MGIEVTYRRLTKTEWRRLQRNPTEAAACLFSDFPGCDPLSNDIKEMLAFGEALLARYGGKRRRGVDRVELGKDWQALHFLLTGDSGENVEHRPDNPLHNVVMGGQATKVESGYGPVRIFQSADVKAIASALEKVSVRRLRSRFSAREFSEQEIYPNPRPRGWTLGEVEGLFEVFPQLVKLFRDAAAAGDFILIYAI